MGLSLRNIRKKIVDVFDANTQEDQRKRLAAGQPRMYQQQHPTAPRVAPPPMIARPVQPVGSGRDARGLASKLYDQVNFFDNGRTFKNDTPVNIRSNLAQATHNGLTNTVGNVLVKPLVLNPLQTGAELTRMGAATVTKNKKAQDVSRERLQKNVDESLLGYGKTLVSGVGSGLGNFGAAAYADIIGDEELGTQLRDEGIRQFNRTPFGQITNIGQKAVVNYGTKRDNKKLTEDEKNKLVDKNLESINIDPKASLGKQVTDTASSALQLYGMAEGIKSGGQKINAFKEGKTPLSSTDIAIRERLNNRPTNLKTIEQSTKNMTDAQRLKLANGDTGQAGLMSAEAGTRRFNPATGKVETIPPTEVGLPKVTAKGTTQPIVESPVVKPGTVPPVEQPISLPKNTPKSILDRAVNAKEYVKQQTALQKAAAKSAEKGKVGKFIAKAKTATVDALNPLEAPINKAFGYKAEATLKLRNQLDRSLRGRQLAGAFAEHEGLTKVIKGVKDKDTFDQYVIAKHAQDLEANGIKTGRDLAADQNLIDAVKGDYEVHAQALTKYNHALLDEATNSGLISPETNAYLKQKYPNYVPFDRIFSEGELNVAKGTGSGPASLSTQTVVQRIKGSERQIASPLESIASKTNDVVTQGERNKAARMTIETHQKAGTGAFRELAPDEQIGTKPTISYMDNGVKRTFETIPEIAKAAKAMNPVQQGVWGKVFSYPTRVIRLGATGANVSFAMANVAKDLASAFINSEHPLYASIGNPKVFMQALDAAFHHGGAAYKELVGEGAGGTSFDIGRNSAKVSVAKIRADRNIGTKAVYTVRHPSELLRAVEDTIGRSEEFGRAIQYFGNKEVALKQNKGQAYARMYGADAARNNTVNFARAGEYGRVLNSAVPYLNAGVQGSRTLMRNVKDRPLQTGAKIALVGFVPTATATAWNLSDPKRKAAYDDISEYEKENNIIIVPPNPKQDAAGRWNVIKIPVSQEIANLNNIVRNGVEARAKDKNFNFTKMAGDLIGTATSVNAQSPRQAVGQFTPQAIKPVVETVTNKNLFTGNQIVPDAIKNLDPKDQYNKNTSGTAKVIGRATGTSPLQIDNTIRTATGGLGQNIINTTDTALAKVGLIKKDEVRGKSLPTAIANRFNSAQGKTDGAKYFETVQDQTKKHKLAGRDYEALQSILAKEIDGNGQPIKQNEKDTLYRNRTLASNPNVAAVLSDSAKELAKKSGKKIDPIYNLTPEQQNTYYQMQSSSYNGQDYNRFKDKNKNWMPAFQEERAKYYQDLKLDPPDDAKVKYPLDKSQQKTINDYFAVEDSAKRGELIKSNPEISRALSSLAKYGNDRRVAQGFDALDTYPETPPIVQKWTDEYFAQPKGTKMRWQRNNKEKWEAVSQDMASKTIYTLQEEAAKSQFKDTGLSQKELKAIDSLGEYNISKQTDANGNTFYTLGSSGDSGGSGGYGGGSGGGGGGSEKVANPYKYAVSLKAGKVSLKGKAASSDKAKSKGKKFAVAKPKVTSKKSRV